MPVLHPGDHLRPPLPGSGPAPEALPASSLTGPVLDLIGRRLRSAYDGTLKDPLPVRLADLLDRLQRRESRHP
jgi:hypothetical protein